MKLHKEKQKESTNPNVMRGSSYTDCRSDVM